VEIDVRCRRYACQQCDAVVLVVPRGVLARKLFTASAIALSLALWALDRAPAPVVRKKVSPWQTIGEAAAVGWASLRRWTDAASRGELFGGQSKVPSGPPRLRAAALCSWLLGHAPPSLRSQSQAAQVFAGAVHAM